MSRRRGNYVSVSRRFDPRLADRARREQEEELTAQLREARNTWELLAALNEQRRTERAERERRAMGRAF